jgi:hypothetical protein
MVNLKKEKEKWNLYVGTCIKLNVILFNLGSEVVSTGQATGV